jgi:type VI protein secretion system component VasF
MVSKKKSTTKKSAPRAVASRKRKSTSKRPGIRRYVSLQQSNDDFMSVRFTTQTLYWLVLGVVVVLFTLWLMHLQASIQEIYDQIDANTASNLNLTP